MTTLTKSRIHYRVPLLRQVWKLCSCPSMQLSLYYFVISWRFHQLYTNLEFITLGFDSRVAIEKHSNISPGDIRMPNNSYSSLHCRYSRLKDATAIRQPYKLLYSNRFLIEQATNISVESKAICENLQAVLDEVCHTSFPELFIRLY